MSSIPILVQLSPLEMIPMTGAQSFPITAVPRKTMAQSKFPFGTVPWPWYKAWQSLD